MKPIIGSAMPRTLRRADPLLTLLAYFDRRDLNRGWHLAAMIMLMLVISYPFRWSGNEENYFPLAYRFVYPEAFGASSAVFDASRSKFAGFWMIGELVGLVGYEAAHLILAVLIALLLGYALYRVTRALGLSALEALCLLFLFYASGQALMGGEGFLSGVETKTFAYAFGLLALADVTEARWLRATLWAALATYMHFEVGGLWFAIAAAFLLLVHRDWRSPLAMCGLYALLTLPELGVLVLDQHVSAAAMRPTGSPSADYIYTVIRNAHHIAPFAAVDGWREGLARGLGYAVLIMLVAARAARSDRPRLRTLGWLTMLLAAYMFVAAGLSWLDRDTGALGKFYLFRPASALFLLALIMGFALWREMARGAEFGRLLPIAAIMAVIFIQGLTRPLNGQERPLDARERAMVTAVATRTRPDDVVLLDPATDTRAGLSRQLDRQTLVVWKFVPTAPADIYRWWDLIKRRSATFSGDCTATRGLADYLVATEHSVATAARCGRTAWSNGYYTLIALPARRAA
ncbi:MAG: hypothetical protein JOY99_07935 [Sphingomonadaceae bacterium]|nr:hypothetical protein [Sphingomonadaceae bacterium]